MAFELNIAVKHDPADQPSNLEGATHGPCLVTIVEVMGELSPLSSADLTRRLEDIVSAAPSSVIIRFLGDVRVSLDEFGSLDTVAAWVKRRRRDGCNLYVEVAQAKARDAFMRVDDMRDVMLPVGADAAVPRRIVAGPPPIDLDGQGPEGRE